MKSYFLLSCFTERDIGTRLGEGKDSEFKE